MRPVLILIILSIINACLLPKVFAQGKQQAFKFRHLEENVNLSHLNIDVILQDSYGFLWVGTDDGLNRFDGYDFKIYRNIEDDSTSLAYNKIQSIYEDSNNTLWVSTLNTGLHYYDRQQDRFIRISKFTEPHCQVMQIVEDSDNNLWICGVLDSYSFVAKKAQNALEWEVFPLLQSTFPFETILPYSKTEFWLGKYPENGLYKWNPKTNEINNIPDQPGLNQNYIEKLAKDNDGNLWIASRDGLSKLDKTSNEFKSISFDKENPFAVNNETILDIYTDNDYLWISIENEGLVRIQTQTGDFTSFVYDKSNQNSIISNSIWTIYKDRQKRIWLGSYSKGLSVMDKMEEKFSLPHSELNNDLINDIYEDTKGRIWYATEDGLVMSNKNGLQRFRFDPQNESSISSNAILCIFEDSKGRIWIGTWNGGFNRYHDQSGNFTRYLVDPELKPGSLTNPNVFSISEDKITGELLVCTFGGLHILKDEKKGVFDYIYDNTQQGDVNLNSILMDSKENVWVGAYSGFHDYSLKTKKIRKLSLSTDSLQHELRVNCIYEDSKGQIWIGSHGGGLHLMVDYNKFKHYNIKSGLPSNIIHSIAEDENGNMWIGTTKGLSKLDINDQTFKTYDESDGLLSNQIKSIFITKEGLILVGGKGVNSFIPENLKENPYKPEVYLTALKIFNQTILPNDSTSILKKAISETKEIIIDYNQSFLTLNYIGINFTSSYKNQYAYKLEGFDNEWNYVGDQRFATFMNLAAGTYTFHVKAANNDGLWNEEGTKLKIIVLPPWWKTLWFRALCIIFITLTLLAIYYKRINNIKILNTKLERLVQMRTKELEKSNTELIKSQNELKQKNNDLVIAEEETAAQRDQLEGQNKQLEEARDLIELKNEEILQQNQTLEDQVNRRTKELLVNLKQLEDFAFMAAHNLRGPVARILGLGELLKLSTNKEDDKNIKRRLITSAFELDSVVHDINETLEIRKSITLVKSAIRLSDVMQSVERILKSEINKIGAEILTDFSSNNEIYTVGNYIQSVLINLISNSLKYRHPERPPVIFIWSSNNANSVSIFVRDNGIGMDIEGNKEKLFRLYSRFHNNRSGKGLGLFMAKTQVEALGGKIDMSSNSDFGLTISITFPKHQNLKQIS